MIDTVMMHDANDVFYYFHQGLLVCQHQSMDCMLLLPLVTAGLLLLLLRGVYELP